jgi:hypothetical protein
MLDKISSENFSNQPEKVKDPFPYTALLPYYPNYALGKVVSNISKITYGVEYEMVKRGYREANIYHVFPESFDTQLEKIRKDGLTFIPLLRSKSYNGFSHSHFHVDKLGSGTMVYGVVAKDTEIANEFFLEHKNIESGGSHKHTGDLLGYPECCSESFTEYFKKSGDPVYEVAQSSKHKIQKDGSLLITDFDPLLQIHLRYFGLKVIPWFPCSFNCEESSKRAKQWLSVIKDVDKEQNGNTKLTEKLLELLNKPSSWDLNMAQAVIKHPDFYGYCASYYTPEKRIIEFNPNK